MSPASDQSGRESPMSECLDQTATDGKNTRPDSSTARPQIVVHKAEGIQESSGSTEKTPEPGIVDKVSEKVRDSSSSHHGSSKSLDAPRSPQNPAGGLFIPDAIACNLRVTFENSKSAEELSVPLHKPESYQKIQRAAEKHAKSLSAESIGPKELKFFYGKCTIVSDNGPIIRHPLRSPEDWIEVNKAIVGYWNLHTHERLRLCISRHYLASQEQPIRGKSFADAKLLEIDDLMKQTWERKDYIAHNVLETVVSDDVISWIIKENPPESVAQEQQDSFIHRVQAEGRILLAMCVHKSLRMECLKKLLDSGLKDSTLPLDDTFLCHQDCRSKFKSLVKTQGGYRAERFIEGEHKKLKFHAVVPLYFCPRDNGKDDLQREVSEVYGQEPQYSDSREKIKEDAWCGSGAYSNVYCVKINPNHHSLSADLESCFALKEFKDKPQLVENFERELAMLKELRRHSHPHIVTHLATWTQDERHYMLFPYALCNLREYMGQNTFVRKDAVWLLHQFHGMAGAVKRIHDLSVVEAQTASLNPDERRTAWHHDIKPENILFFKDVSSSQGIFRISDWGSAKVNLYRTRSYHTKSPIGTLTYEPPEYTYDGKTSRPYDLWSLGCVFLEILVWAAFGCEGVEAFSGQRDDKRNTKSGTSSTNDDTFWHKFGNEYQLRRNVVTQLDDLEKEFGKSGALPFKEVVGYVRRMLETKTLVRIKALELHDALGRITEQNEVEAPKDESKPVPRLTIIPQDRQSPDARDHQISPSGRSSGPAYTENYDSSPCAMSPHANRLPSHAAHSRQSSNASNRSTLSVRDRRGSHSSANSAKATEGGT